MLSLLSSSLMFLSVPVSYLFLRPNVHFRLSASCFSRYLVPFDLCNVDEANYTSSCFRQCWLLLDGGSSLSRSLVASYSKVILLPKTA